MKKHADMRHETSTSTAYPSGREGVLWGKSAAMDSLRAPAQSCVWLVIFVGCLLARLQMVRCALAHPRET